MPVKIPPSKLSSFLTAAQSALSPTSSRQEIRQANNDALQQGIHASLHHDDGLTAAQKFARETGNPKAIEEANQAALEQAIAASRRTSAPAAKPVRSTPSNEELAANHGVIAKLKRWLTTHGFIIKPNNGDRNNCLLISMLQHVTGDFQFNSKPIRDKAAHYKALIVDWSGGKVGDSSSLFSDDDITQLVIEQINQDHFGADRSKYLQFEFVTADLDGNPAKRYVGNGPRIAGIVDGGGHYEAFVKQGE